MKKNEIIFEWNFRDDKEFEHALDTAHKQILGNINSDLYYSIKIDKKFKKRTLSQNGTYQIFATYIANNCSQYENAKEVKFILRSMFLSRPEEEISEFITYNAHLLFNQAKNGLYDTKLDLVIDLFTYSTAELKTKQFATYLEQISQFSSEVLELPLVFPDEDSWQDFFNEYKKLNK